MKNYVNKKTVLAFGKAIHREYKTLDLNNFIKDIMETLENLELFERLDLITTNLKKYLPDSYPVALDILLKSLAPELPLERKDLDGLELWSEHGFINVSITNYVAYFGLDYFDISMNALYDMTKRFSAEGAIRYFILENPEKCYEYFDKWILDENVHVRRLVSEGLRPKLPWAIRLKPFVKDPSPILKYLNILKEDDELYVRRSVANNINDIAKDHPGVVTDLLKEWNKKKTKEMTWLIKHALRTLIKNGDLNALSILGYKEKPEIEVNNLEMQDSVEFKKEFIFKFNIKSNSDKTENLMVDYIIHHKKNNGSLSAKVFKLKIVKLKAYESLIIAKKSVFRDITTRKYYPGEHRLEIQINGKIYLDKSFMLEM